jgi:hypothetical protein
MTTIANIQQELASTQQLTTQELLNIKGGKSTDEKRRARPGGGTTSTSPYKTGGVG